jgi:hypothetical protein
VLLLASDGALKMLAVSAAVLLLRVGASELAAEWVDSDEMLALLLCPCLCCKGGCGDDVPLLPPPLPLLVAVMRRSCCWLAMRACQGAALVPMLLLLLVRATGTPGLAPAAGRCSACGCWPVMCASQVAKSLCSLCLLCSMTTCKRSISCLASRSCSNAALYFSLA